jgi:hypothetical protein
MVMAALQMGLQVSIRMIGYSNDTVDTTDAIQAQAGARSAVVMATMSNTWSHVQSTIRPVLRTPLASMPTQILSSMANRATQQNPENREPTTG